jgi:hypothetical protein
MYLKAHTVPGTAHINGQHRKNKMLQLDFEHENDQILLSRCIGGCLHFKFCLSIF